MPLINKLKSPNQVLDNGKRNRPLWEGPSGNGPNGGITFSMLSRYLCCKERFRIQYLEGLQVREGFNHRLEFGNMWHLCEENIHGDWRDVLKKYATSLHNRYPYQRQEISHWFAMCYKEFPEYVKYWEKYSQQEKSITLLQEQVFDVPYKLPSGRTVRLRGKWDRVDLQDGMIYLGENKTKSQIDPSKIKRQLTFDLQTMMYLIAMEEPDGLASFATNGRHPLRGVKYNVVRRSAHKSPESMLKKIREDITDNRGGEWFARWTVDVTPGDIQIFKEQCFNELLEEVSDWYRFKTTGMQGAFIRHYRMPYGIYNPLTEGGSSDYDEYLATGSMDGLERTNNLFRELQT